MKKKPFVTIFLVIVNIIIFVIAEILGDTSSAEYMYQIGAAYAPAIFEGKEYYRLVSATFLHFGFEHLFQNMVILFFLGKELEDSIGHLKYIILYAGSGIFGSFLSSYVVYSQGKNVVAAGASGAIFGMLGAFLWIILRNKGRYRSMNLKRMLIALGIMLVYGYLESGVDQWGHLGGFLGGFLLAILLYRQDSIDFRPQNQYT